MPSASSSDTAVSGSRSDTDSTGTSSSARIRTLDDAELTRPEDEDGKPVDASAESKLEVPSLASSSSSSLSTSQSPSTKISSKGHGRGRGSGRSVSERQGHSSGNNTRGFFNKGRRHAKPIVVPLVGVRSKFVWDLYCAAQRYMVHDLKERCELTLCESLTPDNVISRFALAHYHSIRSLYTHCIYYIRQYLTIQDLMKDPDFFTLPREIMEPVLNSSRHSTIPPPPLYSPVVPGTGTGTGNGRDMTTTLTSLSSSASSSSSTTAIERIPTTTSPVPIVATTSHSSHTTVVDATPPCSGSINSTVDAVVVTSTSGSSGPSGPSSSSSELSRSLSSSTSLVPLLKRKERGEVVWTQPTGSLLVEGEGGGRDSDSVTDSCRSDAPVVSRPSHERDKRTRIRAPSSSSVDGTEEVVTTTDDNDRNGDHHDSHRLLSSSASSSLPPPSSLASLL